MLNPEYPDSRRQPLGRTSTKLNSTVTPTTTTTTTCSKTPAAKARIAGSKTRATQQKQQRTTNTTGFCPRGPPQHHKTAGGQPTIGGSDRTRHVALTRDNRSCCYHATKKNTSKLKTPRQRASWSINKYNTMHACRQHGDRFTRSFHREHHLRRSSRRIMAWAQ